MLVLVPPGLVVNPIAVFCARGEQYLVVTDVVARSATR
ncbi:hypothetical protein SAMN05421854_103225 [Amycolatopsis rubida]|uniref:Uncharacterized protein n=1 Tax=Amycolatopsis rubida TaxID=112413 RepID=A0A1I5KJM9_9PSEU|nr:hypothetical protein SAMN05421854_103225 [Amycolatopsis rubida]